MASLARSFAFAASLLPLLSLVAAAAAAAAPRPPATCMLQKSSVVAASSIGTAEAAAKQEAAQKPVLLQQPEEAAAQKEAADKTSAETVITDNVAAQKAPPPKPIGGKPPPEAAPAKQEPTSKPSQPKEAADGSAAKEAPAEKAATEKEVPAEETAEEKKKRKQKEAEDADEKAWAKEVEEDRIANEKAWAIGPWALACLALMVYVLVNEVGSPDVPVSNVSTETKTFMERLPRAKNAKGAPGFDEIPNYVHLQGMVDGRFLVSNVAEPYHFENEFLVGKVLPLTRPVCNKSLDNEKGWLYGKHFANRKRMWEIRYQFTFKKPIDGRLFFGVQGHDFNEWSWPTLKTFELILAAVRKGMGVVTGGDQGIYFTMGDDPKKVNGEVEPPTVSMPLWAFDQYIETPKGEEPPNLNDPGFADLGILRTTDRTKFIDMLADWKPKPGVTYSFGFWGLSPMLDILNWCVRGFTPYGLDFNNFCGAPPIHNVLYALKEDPDEPRHLESRREYLIHGQLWVSTRTPKKRVIEELVHFDTDLLTGSCIVGGAEAWVSRRFTQ